MIRKLALTSIALAATFTVTLTITSPSLAGSSSKHQNHSASAAVESAATGGQAAFMEITQIVAELDADPTTDWSQVDIAGLRAHLIDMHNVTLHAVVTMETIEGGAHFMVHSDRPDVAKSIQNMVVTHGMMMVAEDLNWTSEKTANGALATVTSTAPNGPARIRGLGLIGLMTLGDHHAAHHRMMARGHGH